MIYSMIHLNNNKILITFFLVIFGLVFSTQAQTLTYMEEFIGYEKTHRGDEFYPYDIDISGKWTVVGTPFADKNEVGEDSLVAAGAVEIYLNQNGSSSAFKKIFAPDRKEWANFGVSVDIENNILAVGAPREEYDASGQNQFNWAGAVYIYEKDQGGNDNWGFVKKVVSPVNDRNEADQFGSSVAFTGEYLLVGAVGEETDENGENHVNTLGGAVYVFSKNEGGIDNWGYVDKVTSEQREIFDCFGRDIEADGKYAVVKGTEFPSEELYEYADEQTGHAYLLMQNENNPDDWEVLKYIRTPDHDYADENEKYEFVTSIALENETLAVGASLNSPTVDTGRVDQAGTVYIYKKNEGGENNWGFSKKLIASNASRYDHFGNAVDINRDFILIGAREADVYVPFINFTYFYSGSAYLYYRNEGGENNWGEVSLISSPNAEDQGHFAESVKLSESYAYIGAPNEIYDTNNFTSFKGRLYAYSFADTLTSINDQPLSTEYRLMQNYPNPFNPTTRIEYQVSSIEKVSLKVYDILGRKIKTLVNEQKVPGNYTVRFDASNLSSGIYLYRLTAGSFTQTRKMIFMK